MKELEDMRLQKEWKAHFKALCGRYRSGQSLEGDDHAQMLYLISTYHPWLSEKVGVGIARFVFKDEPYPKTLHLVRVDGTTTDVSWMSAIKTARGRNRVPDRMLRARKAGDIKHYRDAVREQVELFKAQRLGQLCPVSGAVLTADNSVVHHDPEFSVLLEDWHKATGGCGIGGARKWSDCVRSWIDYHAQHAQLFLVTHEAHKQIHYGAT